MRQKETVSEKVMDVEQNPYACLGLMPGCSQAKIKRRYRQLAKQYHPDCHGQAAEYEDKLRRLNTAYAFLSDSARKSEYDGQYEAALNPACVPPPVSPVFRASFVSRRRSGLRGAIACLVLLLLLSIGFFFAVSPMPSLAGLFPHAPGQAADGSDRPAPAFSFLPSHSPFDSQNTTGAVRQYSQP